MAKSTAAKSTTTLAQAKAEAAGSKAKVGKIDKGAAKEKPAKTKAESGQQGQSAPRGQYANKKITVTEAGKAAAPRGNRGLRWELVKKAKNVNDVLGQEFTRTDGEKGTITSAGISNFVERGFIELS